MALEDFAKEIEYHEKLIHTMLEYQDEKGICKVSHATLAERLKKNQPWVAKAIGRLNAEDQCIEMINKGEYIVHYTNIKERGVFPQIGMLIFEMAYNNEVYHNKQLLSEKYNVTEKTVNIFRGYLALICK